MASTDYNVDLTNCDREPIHIPGYIQSHGCLIACDNAMRMVLRHSENCREILRVDGDINGRTAEEVLGKNHRILKSGHQEDAIFKDLWKTISGGKIWRGEVKNRAKDGSYYWVDAVIAPVLGPDGKPKEYIAQRFVINDKKIGQ